MKSLTLLFSLLLLSGPASAFCVDPVAAGTSLVRWKNGQPLHATPIPVYVVTSGANAVDDDPDKDQTAGAGVTEANFIDITKSAIRALSETSAEIRPYFAGSIPTSGMAVEGIVIQSPDIPNVISSEDPVLLSGGRVGSRITITAANASVEYTNAPADFSSPEHITPLKGLLLHEMLHSFGLNHLHEPCDTSKYSNDPQHCSTAGCQSAFASALKDRLEHPTRDDIEGIRFRFGSRFRAFEVLESSDAANWAPLSFSSVHSTRSPPGISAFNGETFGRGGSAVVFTDQTDFLFIVSDFGGSGLYSHPERVGGALALHRTFHRPAVAIGDDYIVVAWIDEENREEGTSSFRVKFAVKNLINGTWSYPLADDAVLHQEIGLAYDATSGLFIFVKGGLSAGNGFIRAMNAATGAKSAGGNVLNGTGTTPFVIRSISKPSCRDQLLPSECVLTSSRSSDMRSLEFRIRVISGSPGDDAVHLNTLSADSAGRSDLTWGPAGMLATGSNNGSSSNYYLMPSFGSVDTPMGTFTTNYWPAAVGTWSRWTYSPPAGWTLTVRYRAVVAP